MVGICYHDDEGFKVSRQNGWRIEISEDWKMRRWIECLFIGYKSESRSGPRDGNNDDDDVEFDDDHSDGNDDDDDDGKVMLAPPASFSLLAFLTASRSWPRPL